MITYDCSVTEILLLLVAFATAAHKRNIKNEAASGMFSWHKIQSQQACLWLWREKWTYIFGPSPELRGLSTTYTFLGSNMVKMGFSSLNVLQKRLIILQDWGFRLVMWSNNKDLIVLIYSGSHQTVVEQSSSSHRAVVKQSSSSLHAIN